MFLLFTFCFDSGTNLNKEHTHAWGDWVIITPATCNAPGVETRTCTKDDDHTETRAIVRHTCGNWVITTPATCDAPGVETRTSTQDDNYFETKLIAPSISPECGGDSYFNPNIKYGLYIDTRDGNQAYRTVVINGKTWFAENLNYAGSRGNTGVCYDNNSANCVKYGRLYNWVEAMDIDSRFNGSWWRGSDVKHKGICPAGWHIPSYDEWLELIAYANELRTSGTKLKATSGWNWNNQDNISGNGTDDYGFSALPGGEFFNGRFSLVGFESNWWSATEMDARGVRSIGMESRLSTVSGGYDFKTSRSYVRCVQDVEI